MSRFTRRIKAVESLARGFFALVWIANGLWCKLLDGVPRHRAIVARILGEGHSLQLTRLIGIAEILMAVWIVSGIRRRWAAFAQIVAVLLMNLIEFTLAPDLLLFGRLNLLVALAFVFLVAAIEFRSGTPGPPRAYSAKEAP